MLIWNTILFLKLAMFFLNPPFTYFNSETWNFFYLESIAASSFPFLWRCCLCCLFQMLICVHHWVFSIVVDPWFEMTTCLRRKRITYFTLTIYNSGIRCKVDINQLMKQLILFQGLQSPEHYANARHKRRRNTWKHRVLTFGNYNLGR